MDVGLNDPHGMHAGSLLMGHGDEIAREKSGDGLIDRRFAVPSRPDEMDVDPIAHPEKFED